MNQELCYLNGFNQHFESEALANTLPQSRNSPQRVAHGLYAEQLSGSAFTVARHQNKFSWLYRIRPSVVHQEFQLADTTDWLPPPEDASLTPPNQMRWDPMPYPVSPTDFIQSMMTFAGNGQIAQQTGAAILLYACNQSMQDSYFYNADGELLIVPQEGSLRLHTEFGLMDITPFEIAVVPRGVKFYVSLHDDQARGYVCENFGSPFCLPELGVIGANGLANPRDFLSPSAHFETLEGDFKLFCKFQGKLWKTHIQHSPLDVVAWHGTLAPYKYDLRKFNTIGTVSFDHPDPSIFTVLTSPSAVADTANVDFAIFPPRWMVAHDTFRPPYYHRNVMSEYMGLIHGKYDAKEDGFVPGGSSLHNCMAPHGPDRQAFKQASEQALKPEYYDNTMAFMFESRLVWNLTASALYAKFKQKDYLNCWQDLPVQFAKAEPA